MKEEEKKISDADRERRYQISEDFVLRQIGGEYAIIPSCRRRFCSAFYASKGEKWTKNETHGINVGNTGNLVYRVEFHFYR